MYKSYKSAILVLGLMCCLFGLDAQSIGKVDIIVLKDGSMITGVIQSESNMSILIISETLGELAVDRQTIAKVHYDSVDMIKGEDGIVYLEPQKKPKIRKKDGIFYSTDIGGSIGTETGASFNFNVGRRMKHNLYLGANLGIESTSHTGVFWETANLLILGGYARFYPFRNSGLFTDARVGYGFSVHEDWENKKGGLNVAGSLGYHFKSRKSLSWYVALTQSMQKVGGSTVRPVFNDDVQIYNYDLWLGRVAFKVGIEF